MNFVATFGTDRFDASGDNLEFDAGLLKAFDLWLSALTQSPPSLPGEAVTLRFIPYPLLELGKDGRFMLLLTATQQCGLQLDPRDAKGNPALVDGTPVWTVGDPSIIALDVAADGKSANVRAIGPIGTAQVNVTADVRLGEEILEKSGTLDVEVKASEAVSLGVTTGTPSEQTT